MPAGGDLNENTKLVFELICFLYACGLCGCSAEHPPLTASDKPFYSSNQMAEVQKGEELAGVPPVSVRYEQGHEDGGGGCLWQ